MRKLEISVKIAGVALGLVVIVIGWWLLKPLFVDKQVDEALPVVATVVEQSTTKPMTTSSDDSQMKDAAMKPHATMSIEAAEPTVVKYEGVFTDGVPGHHAKGKAYTLRNGDVTTLRLEELDATNGPDLYLYLAKLDGKTSEGINLGKLKGNQGNQNYEVPEGTDLSLYSKVVIYCKQFSVDFGYSELKKM